MPSSSRRRAPLWSHAAAVVLYATSNGKISGPKCPAFRDPRTAFQISTSAGDKCSGGGESSRAHHAFRRLRRFPVVVEKGLELAGLLCDRLVSETADPWFRRRIGAFFSALEIPFPGNGDRSRQRLRARL